MALTTPDPRLVAKVWSRDLWKDIAIERYWSRFMGAGQNNPIQVMNDLKGKGRGDTITIPLLYKLEGPGIVGCNTLEGNEEAMVEDAMTVTVDMLRHGVRFACEKSDYLHIYDMRLKAKEYFRYWWAERDDKEIFKTLAASPTSLRKYDVDILGATLTGDDILNAFIAMKEMARLARPKIRPIRINGGDHYVCVLHPYVARFLRQSAAWKEIQSSANVRGNDNPIFRGSLGMYDGVIIHEHESVVVNTVGTGNAAHGVASNLFFGAQAGIWAQSKDVFWRESTYKDYGNEVGIATGMIYGFKKAKFTDGYHSATDGPQDYGVIVFTAPAAAAAKPVAPSTSD